MTSGQQHRCAELYAALGVARAECRRSIELRLDSGRLLHRARADGDDDHATATTAAARAAVMQCAASEATVGRLQDLLLRDQATLSQLRDSFRQAQTERRASSQQHAVLAEEICSLTELLATRDAQVHRLVQEVEKLNAEVQQGYDEPAAPAALTHVARRRVVQQGRTSAAAYTTNHVNAG
jgi:septal ring factor EnvC (AmiA/AmiB activator)